MGTLNLGGVPKVIALKNILSDCKLRPLLIPLKAGNYSPFGGLQGVYLKIPSNL